MLQNMKKSLPISLSMMAPWTELRPGFRLKIYHNLQAGDTIEILQSYSPLQRCQQCQYTGEGQDR